ncbi:MAG: Zn-dependent hydrolase [Synergistetes bacterium HGW-Synergistetes-2]|nr:MAG: Zn-dependent hydrolase [Synergistetes bacterium HGW-Synergistetes-2]
MSVGAYGNTILEIDGALFFKQIELLGEIGTDPSGGRTRLALSDQDKCARDLLVQWMKELELDVKIDPVGNIFGILYEEDESCADALMIGSHIDTVINAGPLDGVYGVLSGLAVARAIRDAGVRPLRPLIVAAFTNEEGVRFQPDMMGSLFFTGGIRLEDVLETRGVDGALFGEELRRIEYKGETEPSSLHPAEYLELHVEQGPILDGKELDIGVVENLQGISWKRIEISGTANHAGTTPVSMRRDAGVAAARIIVFLRDLALASEGTRTTVGSLRFFPDAINVIPSKAVLTVDIRDPDDERVVDAESKLLLFLEELRAKEGVEITVDNLVRFEPVRFDEELASVIGNVAKRRGFSSMRITSGAGHDAQMLARVAKAAMIFVPSRGGISHNPAEYTPDTQLLQGANVLLDVAAERLFKERKNA